MSTTSQSERVETVVVGGGQAGLSVGYHLARRERPFVILEANERVGDSWRKRWDSLRLFTPARYDGIAGMPFPAPPHSFPTKDEMADYLESYAARFALPVRTGTRVERVTREGDRYVVTAGDRRYEADNVVVAMASFQRRRVPAFAAELDPDIVQLHSEDYRNPAQLRDGDVLIVGAGNSGAEIAVELARTGRRTYVAGRDVGQIPFDVTNPAVLRLVVPVIFRVLFHRVLTTSTPMGRKARPHVITKGGPLIRTRSGDLAAAGVERVPRTVGVRGGRPVLEDGRALDVANVIWCTGFEPGFSWIDLPIFDDAVNPRHERGVCTTCDGMYFVGLLFLHAFSSTMIHGVERDAAHVVDAIAARARRRPTAAAAPVS